MMYFVFTRFRSVLQFYSLGSVLHSPSLVYVPYSSLVSVPFYIFLYSFPFRSVRSLTFRSLVSVPSTCLRFVHSAPYRSIVQPQYHQFQQRDNITTAPVQTATCNRISTINSSANTTDNQQPQRCTCTKRIFSALPCALGALRQYQHQQHEQPQPAVTNDSPIPVSQPPPQPDVRSQSASHT